jgi:hypothetical protein
VNTLNVRPAFYRPREGGVILSGWQATTTGDIYTLDESGQGYVLVAGARPALLKGERVEFNHAVDLYPSDYIEERERGIVSHVDLDTGTVSVLLEGVHMGLGDNTLTLTPHNDEEALAALDGLSPPLISTSLKREAADSALSMACAVATLMVTVPLTLAVQHFDPSRYPSFVFALAVAWASIALGQRSALVLAAVTPFVFNLVIVPPAFSFTPLQPFEYVLTAYYFAVALFFPWVSKGGFNLLRRALGLCYER